MSLSLKERFQLGLPNLFRPDLRAWGLGTGALSYWYMSDIRLVLHPSPASALPFVCYPAARLLFWTADLLNADSLHRSNAKKRLKQFRKGRVQVKLLRRNCHLRQGGSLWFQKENFLPPADCETLERVEAHLIQIEHQFNVLEPFLQRHLVHILPQVTEQAVAAMEIGQRLAVILEYLSHENLERLEAEERQLRADAERMGVGPVATLHAQTCRFKAQQIANVRNARQFAELYQAQIRALEAGLGNIRGRMASMTSIERADVGLALESLDTELAVMDEGLRLAANAFSPGAAFQASPAGAPQAPFTPTVDPSPEPAARRTRSAWQDGSFRR